MPKFMPLLIVAVVISGAVGAMLGASDGTQAEPARQINVVSTEKPVATKPKLAPNAAYVSRKEDGHYWTNASVDGTSVQFLVDTGASIVALTWRDAQRLRLKPKELDFRWPIHTANGKTFGASVKLDSIRIGNVKIKDVEAMVMQDGLLESSLLGMSFLGELYSYEFKGDTLIIRK
ncbi:MAG: TIGR02281 family clan AA aspartic protease [Pseudomonadota bacterium]